MRQKAAICRQQGRRLVETQPDSCEMYVAREAFDPILPSLSMTCFVGGHPRWALGAHSSQKGDPKACCGKHQESSTESTAEASSRDTQETCGRPGGSSLRQPDLCHCQWVGSPEPCPFCLTASKTRRRVGWYQASQWIPEVRWNLERVCSTPS